MSENLKSVLFILLALFLILLNGFFVAAEYALLRVRITRIEEMAQKGVFGARKTREVVAHLSDYLPAIQLGVTLASLGLGYIGEPAFAQLVEPLFGKLGETAKRAIGGAIAFTIITALHIVLGELAPKSLAIQKAESIALGVAYPLDFFHKLFRWPALFLNFVASLVLKPFGISPAAEFGHEPHSEAELKLILNQSKQGGEIPEEEYHLVNRVLDFGREIAREIMVPRPDVVFLSTSKTIAENIQIAEASAYTRFPLVEDGSPDDVVGMIHVKDLLALSRQPTTEPDADHLRRIARELPRIPETKQIDELLREFQRARRHMAVIIDEYGGTAGIVTLEDIVEEIVGDIQDEFDRTAPELEPVGEDCYNVDARISLAKLHRVLEITPHEEDSEVETLSGWLLARISDRPLRIGDSFSYSTATITIVEMTGRRIRKARICIPEREIVGGDSAEHS